MIVGTAAGSLEFFFLGGEQNWKKRAFERCSRTGITFIFILRKRRPSIQVVEAIWDGIYSSHKDWQDDI